MSPTKRPSAVDSLRRATGGAPRIREDDSIGRPEDIGSLVAPAKAKTVRITLDLDQAAYAALNQWLGSAAAEVGAPVSKARALRAMIRAVSLDKSIGLVVVDLLRRDNS